MCSSDLPNPSRPLVVVYIMNKSTIKDGRSFGFDGMHYTESTSHSQSLAVDSKACDRLPTFRDLESYVRIAANANKDVLLLDCKNDGGKRALRLAFVKI